MKNNIKVYLADLLLFFLIAAPLIYNTSKINAKTNNIIESNKINALNTENIYEKESVIINQKKTARQINFLNRSSRLNDLKIKIDNTIGINKNNVAIAYYDINTGDSIKINENISFLAASTVKVPINMLLYDMVYKGEINENEKLTYTEGDYEDGAGILQGQDLSQPLSISDLSRYSIVYSDNIAINMILDRIGIENRFAYLESILRHNVDHNENYTTADDSLKILERLYENPDNNPYYENLINLMKNTVYHDRIDKLIPQQIVAHKIGDYNEYVNDIGIVYTKNPYIIVILTKNIPNANELIGQISKIIYDNVIDNEK
jgi:beta-lactamase class A